MNDNEQANETPHALTDLPLNVIFRVLSCLDLKELQNVARCCKILRVLANENLILTNNLIDLNSRRDQWTRRLIFDVFDILNGSRNLIFKLTTAYNLSVVESIRIVQRNYGLGYSKLAKIEEVSKSPCLASEELGMMNATKYPGTEKILTNTHNELGKSNNCNIERETVTYLKILQGFHNIALSAQQDQMDKKVDEDTWDDSDRELCLEENLSENEHDLESDVGTPIQSYKKGAGTTAKHTRTVSPTSSDYSKSSTNSIFSELPPKLSSRGWHSSIYELEHVSDHLPHANSDDGTSSSSESIVKLRNSNKVKDKAALFEKLISNDYTMSGNQKKLKKKKSYGILPPSENSDMLYSLSSSFSNSKRNISQGYLEELERCNLIIAGIPTNMTELDESADASASLGVERRKDMTHIKEDCESKRITNTSDDSVKNNKPRNTRQRSKLKAFVTNDNKICYEKL